MARIEELGEAEPLLLEAYEGMKGHPEATDERKREDLERIVKLYEAWDIVEPAGGYGVKADEWRAELGVSTNPPAESAPTEDPGDEATSMPRARTHERLRTLLGSKSQFFSDLA